VDTAWLALQHGHDEECVELAAAADGVIAPAGLFAIEDIAATLDEGRTSRRNCLEASVLSMFDGSSSIKMG